MEKGTDNNGSKCCIVTNGKEQLLIENTYVYKQIGLFTGRYL